MISTSEPIESLMGDVKDAIGPESYEALLATFGGKPLYVPKKPMGAHHPIAQAIGEQSAEVLRAEFSGMSLMLPVTAKRRAVILSLINERKLSVYQIAEKVLCTPRYVWKLKAQTQAAPISDQLGLF